MSNRKDSLQKYDDDRTGFTYRKSQLIRQRGLLVAPDEVDDLRRIKKPKPRWRAARENSTTTTAVNTPTVYTIAAGTGVNSLGQSNELTRDGAHQHYYMRVVSDGGAVDITAVPQIIVGTQGNRLTLVGTSDTNTVQVDDGDGVTLTGGASIILKEGTKLTLVFNDSTTSWTELIREEGLLL